MNSVPPFPFVSSVVETRASSAAPAARPSIALDTNGKGGFAGQAARLAGMAGALFGWRPDEFWRATPAELEAVLAALAGPRQADAPPDAVTLAALKERFPDG